VRRLLSHTVWAPDAIAPEDYEHRNLTRVMFPVIDVLFFYCGLNASWFGVPAISEFFADHTVDLYAYSLAAVSVACLVGVAFPALWALEILAKSALLSLVSLYFLALFILTAVGEGNRGFVVGIAAVAMCPVIWRINQLGSQWQKRRLAAKAERLVAEQMGG
jgi:hypothetical protein